MILRQAIEAIFDIPIVFELWQKFVKKREYHHLLSQKLFSNNRETIIDFGCGTGQQAAERTYLHYYGIDPLEKCIKKAQKKYHKFENVTFILGNQRSLADKENLQAELFIGLGVLHHMPDQAVKELLANMKNVIVSNGRAFFLEPVYFQNQRKLAKRIIGLDRGAFPRSVAEYKKLLDDDLFRIEVEIHTNLFRIPYDVCSINIIRKKFNP